MKKDVIPEIPEDQRAMFPVDPRILVRRAPSTAAACEGVGGEGFSVSRATRRASRRGGTFPRPRRGAAGAESRLDTDARENEGDAAFEWMSIAQAFAGGATDGPARRS